MTNDARYLTPLPCPTPRLYARSGGPQVVAEHDDGDLDDRELLSSPPPAPCRDPAMTRAAAHAFTPADARVTERASSRARTRVGESAHSA